MIDKLNFPRGVALAVARDQHRCGRCARDVHGLLGHGWSVIRRQEAGTKGAMMPHLLLPSNLITVCGAGTFGCAGQIRRREAMTEAMRLGFVVAQHDWPASVPIVIGDKAVWLADDGTVSDTAPKPVEAEAAP